MFNSVNRVIRVYRRFVERIRYRISLKIRFTLKLAIDKSEYFRKLIFNKFFKKWKQVITNTIINQSAQKIQKFCSKTVLILRRTQKQIAFEKLRNLIIAHLIYKQILPFFKVFSISEKINLANNHFKSFIFKHLMKNIINFDKSKLMWRLLRIPDSLNKKHLRKALKQFHSFILKSQMNDSVCKIQKQYRKKLNSKVNYKKFKVLSNRLSQLNDKYSELKRYIFLRWIRLKNRRLIEKSSSKIYNFLSVRWIKLKIKRKLSDLVCKYFVKYDEDRKNKLVNNIKRYLENNMINNCTKIQKYLKFYQILNHIIDRKLMMKNFIIFKELYKLTRLKKILEKILYRNFINRLITKNNFLLKMCKVFQSLDQYTNRLFLTKVNDRFVRIYCFRSLDKLNGILFNLIFNRIKPFYYKMLMQLMKIKIMSISCFTYQQKFSHSFSLLNINRQVIITNYEFNSNNEQYSNYKRVNNIFERIMDKLLCYYVKVIRFYNLYHEIKSEVNQMTSNIIKICCEFIISQSNKFHIKFIELNKLSTKKIMINIFRKTSQQIFVKSLLREWLSFTNHQKINKKIKSLNNSIDKNISLPSNNKDISIKLNFEKHNSCTVNIKQQADKVMFNLDQTPSVKESINSLINLSSSEENNTTVSHNMLEDNKLLLNPNTSRDSSKRIKFSLDNSIIGGSPEKSLRKGILSKKNK